MGSNGRDGQLPLFETKEGKGRWAFKLFAASIFVGISLIWTYRWSYIPREEGRTAWIGLFAAEIWFGLYGIITQAVRWSPIYRSTFKERLSQRYEKDLPGVDIFVCTADPTVEPPILVINTVLSVMAYNYPPENLTVYLSDDGGSALTFYALLEASGFSKYWNPFCKKFKVEPRSPAAYFSTTPFPPDGTTDYAEERSILKRLYEEMENRIQIAATLGRIPEEIRALHKGFSEWNSPITSRDHQTILQILIDGQDSNGVDTEGLTLPKLVYLAREKRPQHPHNFKAGAVNALIRVSSEISSGAIILNVDCDMYSNNSDSVRDALCFFMDEEKGHEIAYVQFPQNFNNITKNDIYGNSLRVINQVEMPGLDGYGGPLYVGTGCFHRRESLSGRRYSKDCKADLKTLAKGKENDSVKALEERTRELASCTYEKNTQWGKEMGLKYGCPVEDVITGLSIQCRGWKSVYFNPDRKSFLGFAPMALEQSLIQQKRLGEGTFQIFLSKYCPLLYGRGKISFGLQLGYCHFNLWALNSFPTLYYVLIPSLGLLNGISLFPKMSSPWLIPFAYVIVAKSTYSLGEALWCGETVASWWHFQRMTIMRRTSSFLFGVIDTILKLVGLANLEFALTAKVADQEVSKRYKQEIMEFGSSSPMFLILATVAVINLICLLGGAKWVITDEEMRDFEPLILQAFLCGLLVIINFPIYQALFFRRDKGRLPASLTLKSLVLAVLICLMPMRSL